MTQINCQNQIFNHVIWSLKTARAYKQNLLTHLEYAQRLRVEVEDADALLRDDGADGLEGGAVVRLLVLPVLHKLAREDVLLEVQSRYEVVILPVHLVSAAGPGCVWKVIRYRFIFVDTGTV